MIDDPVLLNEWYIVATASELKEEALLAARLWTKILCCGEKTVRSWHGEITASIAAPNFPQAG